MISFKAHGLDEVSSCVLKKRVETVDRPSEMSKKSLEEGLVPSVYKGRNVVMIFKKNEKMNRIFDEYGL